MIMVLQYQKVAKKQGAGYKGTATYLTDMMFEETDFDTAYKAIAEAIRTFDVISSLNNADIALTVDGATGKWGCEIQYHGARYPFPLDNGLDLVAYDEESPNYDY